MGIPNDELTRIEVEASKRVNAGDTEGARELCQSALAFEMTPLERVEWLASLASTYAYERNRAKTEAVLEEAWKVLDEQTDRPEHLRKRLSQILGFCTGTTIGLGWCLVFVAGSSFWAISYLSGAQFVWGKQLGGPALVLVPVFAAVLVAASNAGQLSRNWLIGTIRLLLSIAIGSGLGYGLFASGIVQFGYGATL